MLARRRRQRGDPPDEPVTPSPADLKFSVWLARQVWAHRTRPAQSLRVTAAPLYDNLWRLNFFTREDRCLTHSVVVRATEGDDKEVRVEFIRSEGSLDFDTCDLWL